MGNVVTELLSLMCFGPKLQMFQPEGNNGSYLVISILFAYASMESIDMAWRIGRNTVQQPSFSQPRIVPVWMDKTW